MIDNVIIERARKGTKSISSCETIDWPLILVSCTGQRQNMSCGYREWL